MRYEVIFQGLLGGPPYLTLARGFQSAAGRVALEILIHR